MPKLRYTWWSASSSLISARAACIAAIGTKYNHYPICPLRQSVTKHSANSTPGYESKLGPPHREAGEQLYLIIQCLVALFFSTNVADLSPIDITEPRRLQWWTEGFAPHAIAMLRQLRQVLPGTAPPQQGTDHRTRLRDSIKVFCRSWWEKKYLKRWETSFWTCPRFNSS